MKKPYRQADGFYHVDGKKYKTLFGSREQVMNGTVHKTTGGLTKEDLVMNKWGRIVSAKKFKTAKKEMRLQKYGFFAKKGKFGAVSRKMRGGKEGDATAPNVVPAVETTNVVQAADPKVDAATAVDPATTAPTTEVPVPAPAPVAEVPAPTTSEAPTTSAAPTVPSTNPAANMSGGKSKKQNKSKKRR